MAIPPNIENFNNVAAQTFAILYENFPVPCNLRLVEDYAIWWEGNLYESGNKDEPEEVHFIESTLDWLQDSGYLKYDGYSYPIGFMDAVLTLKGLEILNAVPDVLTSSHTAGELVTEALAEGASESISDIMKFILSKGLEFAGKNLL